MNATQIAQLQSTRKAIGRRIKSQRILADITQCQLAEALGYSSAATVGRIERGNSPVPGEMLHAIAAALGCPVDRLIGVSTGAS